MKKEEKLYKAYKELTKRTKNADLIRNIKKLTIRNIKNNYLTKRIYMNMNK